MCANCRFTHMKRTTRKRVRAHRTWSGALRHPELCLSVFFNLGFTPNLLRAPMSYLALVLCMCAPPHHTRQSLGQVTNIFLPFIIQLEINKCPNYILIVQELLSTFRTISPWSFKHSFSVVSWFSVIWGIITFWAHFTTLWLNFLYICKIHVSRNNHELSLIIKTNLGPRCFEPCR